MAYDAAPPDESAERRERARPIEQLLGVISPEAQLALQAREALQAFARELRGVAD
jgi:hypothetical protein